MDTHTYKHTHKRQIQNVIKIEKVIRTLKNKLQLRKNKLLHSKNVLNVCNSALTRLINVASNLTQFL